MRSGGLQLMGRDARLVRPQIMERFDLLVGEFTDNEAFGEDARASLPAK